MLSNSMLFEIETFYHLPTLHEVLMFVCLFFLRLNKPIARRKRQFKHFDFNNGEKFEKKRHSFIKRQLKANINVLSSLENDTSYSWLVYFRMIIRHSLTFKRATPCRDLFDRSSGVERWVKEKLNVNDESLSNLTCCLILINNLRSYRRTTVHKLNQKWNRHWGQQQQRNWEIIK